MPKIQWASEQQRQFYRAGAHPTLFLGGYGSAKTYGACLKLLRLITKYPGSRWAIIRRVHKQLKATTMVTFDSLVPSSFLTSRNDTDGTRVFTNGSTVQFLGLDTPGTLGVLQGLEINGAFIDQAEEISEKIFDTVDARVGRWTKLADMPERWLFLTANPTDELHWLYERFADESPQRETWREKGYECIVADSRSNRFLPDANLDALLSKDDEFVRRFVRGEWGNPEGRIFDVDALSILEPTEAVLEKIQKGCHLHRSLDHGDSAPTACLWEATDGDQNIYVFREYYAPNRLVSDHRRSIAVLSAKEQYRSQLADPSIFHKTAQKYGGKWCLAPDTPVLKADLSWVRADELNPGDQVAGFDEGETDTEYSHLNAKKAGLLGSDRCWRTAVVEAADPVSLPSYEITLSDGTVLVCSEDHKWLVNPTGGWRLWRKTKQLKVGQKMLRAVDTWEEDQSHGAGYLAAAFDGEGFLTQWVKEGKSNTRVGFSQLENRMLERVEFELGLRGYAVSKSKQPVTASKTGRPTTQLTLCRRAEVLKFLGEIRPARLLPKFSFDRLGRVHVIAKPEIVSIKCFGMRDLVGLQTSTKTLIANGIMSHNSIADEYSDTGVLPHSTALFWSPADNAEMPSRSRIKEYLRVDPDHLHPITREKGAPRLYFVKKTSAYPNGCERAILELKSQRRIKLEEAGGRDIYSDDRDDSVPDHAYDALKYFVISRPPVAREASVKPGLLTWKGYSNYMKRQRSRGGVKVKEGWY